MRPTYLPYADVGLLKVYERGVVEEAFREISYRSELEFEFPQGGCQQRAQMISMLLGKKFHIDNCKIWLFAPSVLHLNDFRTLYTKDKKTLSPGNVTEWGFHVAPVVQIEENGRREVLVIDPAMERSAPLLLDDWFSAIGNSHTGQYCFTLPDIYFFYNGYQTDEYNQSALLFDGTFFNYENPTKDNLTVEKGLALNDMAIRIFHAHIEPLMQRNDPQEFRKLEDLKAIFGNATVLDLLFSQNISGYTENTTHRYAVTHYGDIVSEAKTLFNERLLHWTKSMNALLAVV